MTNLRLKISHKRLLPVGLSRPGSAPFACSLRGNVFWALAGSGIYLACQYLALAALAKLGTPTVLGQFALATALVAPVMALGQMQLRQVQVTDVAGEYRFAEYFAFRAIATLVCLLAITCFAWFIETGSADRGVILLVALVKGFESLSDVAYGRLQRHERLKAIALSTIVRSVLSISLFAVALTLTGSLSWAVATMALVAAAAFVGIDLPAMKKLASGGSSAPPAGEAFRWHKLARLMMITAPLGLTTGAQAFSTNLPRYFLEHFQGTHAVALFAVAAAPLSLITLFSGAIVQAALPRAASHFQAGRLAAFNRVALGSTAIALAIGLAFCCLMGLWGSALIGLLFSDEYRSAAPALFVMSLGVALTALTVSGTMALSASRNFSLQLLNMALVIVVQIPACLLLVPRYGVLGAGWAELIRFGTFVVTIGTGGLVVLARRRKALAHAVSNHHATAHPLVKAA